LLLIACAGVAGAGESADPARRAALLHLVRQDCGSCHGLTLKGGLGPPLLPATLKDKDRAGLAYTILFGRPGTAMPPWKDFMSEAEAHWIVDQLMRGLPDGR
jgi:cytochrome c55X